MPTNYLRLAVVLGLLSAIGPFAIDMYLPALPSIGQDLGASTSAVQMSLTAFFIPFGFCQLFFGPLSDMLGRKTPLYVGLALFVLGSVGSALAPDIGTLLAFRFLQGLGACAGMVTPRAGTSTCTSPAPDRWASAWSSPPGGRTAPSSRWSSA